ncbi:hypothetical protein Dimus_009033 [Dionaea muscipula]
MLLSVIREHLGIPKVVAASASSTICSVLVNHQISNRLQKTTLSGPLKPVFKQLISNQPSLAPARDQQNPPPAPPPRRKERSPRSSLSGCRRRRKYVGRIFGTIVLFEVPSVESWARAKHDTTNTVVAGCVTGGAISARGGPQLKLLVLDAPALLPSRS